MRPWILPVVVALGCVGVAWLRPPAERVDTTGLEVQIADLQAEVAGLKSARDARPAQASPGLITRPEVPQPLQPSVADLMVRMDAIDEAIDALGRALGVEPPAGRSKKPALRASEPRDARPAAAVAGWIEKLRDQNHEVVFTATIELGKLKDARAAEPLREILREHRNLWPRLGAATTLGDLYAADAMPDLVAALGDKEELVRSASAQAIRKICRKDFGYVQGMSAQVRSELQETIRDWWRHNDRDVRDNLANRAKK